MSSFSVFDVAASGMKAQSVRLNTIASNLANAQGVSGSPDTVYHAKQVVFESTLSQAHTKLNQMFGKSLRGVRVSDIIESDAPIEKEYSPNHPEADEAGYIYHSNVNYIREMTNMISTSRSFQSNVEVVKTAKTLMQRTLQLGQ